MIDGTTYTRHTLKFAGNSNLGPGKKHSFTIDLASYLPPGERKGYSKALKEWRWSIPLESGRHTITINLDKKEYGPITFIWKADVPLLYE